MIVFVKDFVVPSNVLGDNVKFFEKYLTRGIAEILSVMFETKQLYKHRLSLRDFPNLGAMLKRDYS